jgi:hypothetical protein
VLPASNLTYLARNNQQEPGHTRLAHESGLDEASLGVPDRQMVTHRHENGDRLRA